MKKGLIKFDEIKVYHCFLLIEYMKFQFFFMWGEMKDTSEIWVTNLELDENRDSKPNSEKLLQHYSKLSEILTRFWWLNFVTTINPLCSKRLIVRQIVVLGSSSIILISFSYAWPPCDTIRLIILRADSLIDSRIFLIDVVRGVWFLVMKLVMVLRLFQLLLL